MPGAVALVPSRPVPGGGTTPTTPHRAADKYGTAGRQEVVQLQLVGVSYL